MFSEFTFALLAIWSIFSVGLHKDSPGENSQQLTIFFSPLRASFKFPPNPRIRCLNSSSRGRLKVLLHPMHRFQGKESSFSWFHFFPFISITLQLKSGYGPIAENAVHTRDISLPVLYWCAKINFKNPVLPQKCNTSVLY